jgi:hypothetical protein
VGKIAPIFRHGQLGENAPGTLWNDGLEENGANAKRLKDSIQDGILLGAILFVPRLCTKEIGICLPRDDEEVSRGAQVKGPMG